MDEYVNIKDRIECYISDPVVVEKIIEIVRDACDEQIEQVELILALRSEIKCYPDDWQWFSKIISGTPNIVDK